MADRTKTMEKEKTGGIVIEAVIIVLMFSSALYMLYISGIFDAWLPHHLK